MKYLHWEEKKINDFSFENIDKLYSEGFVFTRIGKGIMQQTRSTRIDLNKFEPSSENRRILRKTEDIGMKEIILPLENYDWNLGKIAKDFYDERKADFSANKIKELLTDKDKSNFNSLFDYSGIGYAICYTDRDIIHYSYPFYDKEKAPKDIGMGMMLKAIILAKEAKRKYMYIGSLSRKTDIYKLQFSGLEWFDGKVWRNDIEEVKEILNK